MDLITAQAETAAPTGLETILHKPLIVGASVSADYFTASPGKLLALKYTKAGQIKTRAQNGKPAREVLKMVDASVLKDRSVVIGLDLFFWDSFSGPYAESVAALDKLVHETGQNQIPLVLGEVPEFSPQFQPYAQSLNKKMHELCKKERNCRILPLNKMLRQILLDGYLTQGGVKYPLQKLLPDGLHIAAPASEYLAERMTELLGAP